MNSARRINRSIKGWAGWLTLGLIVLAFLVVGATRSTGPETPQERVEDITKRVACPICDGESVFESRNNASRDIRNQVTVLVDSNELGDDEIIGFIETRYGADVLLVPKASGFDALIWVLPAVGFAAGVIGLTIAFLRWRREAENTLDPTDEDRELVEAALRDAAGEDLE
ncbi:MAG: cytochrome c-type biogenesis protein CcmH [Acidimicrobiia bacterium]|nr:cytochrome c-type biogenesis protein CcmH [Acidimicrobiia bacterium]